MASKSSSGFAGSTPSPGRRTTEAWSANQISPPRSPGRSAAKPPGGGTLTRQFDREGAPRSGLRLHSDRPAVAFHDPPRDREPQAAARVAALKPLEQPRQPLLFYAGSVVGDGDHRPGRTAVYAQPHLRTARAYPDGVVDQVGHRLPEQVLVGVDASVLTHLSDDVHAGCRGLRGVGAHHVR